MLASLVTSSSPSPRTDRNGRDQTSSLPFHARTRPRTAFSGGTTCLTSPQARRRSPTTDRFPLFFPTLAEPHAPLAGSLTKSAERGRPYASA